MNVIFQTCKIYKIAWVASIFRKSTFTGIGTSFYSFFPFIHKINGTRTLIIILYFLSSTYNNLDSEVQILRNFFSRNRFPGLSIRVFDNFRIILYVPQKFRPQSLLTFITCLSHILVHVPLMKLIKYLKKRSFKKITSGSFKMFTYTFF